MLQDHLSELAVLTVAVQCKAWRTAYPQKPVPEGAGGVAEVPGAGGHLPPCREPGPGPQARQALEPAGGPSGLH